MQAGEQSSQFSIILKVVDACVLVLCGHYLPPDQITVGDFVTPQLAQDDPAYWPHSV